MRRALCVLAAACLIVGCSSGDDTVDDTGGDGAPADDGGSTGSGDGEAVEARSGEGWTILQYSMADTNLEAPMMADLEEMAEVGTQDGLNLVALVDRTTEETDQDLLNIPNWEGAKLLEVGAGEFTELDDMGDVNTGDPATLAQFIATGVEQYPAANYGLIISDHGASWPGLGPDDSSGGDVLDLAELGQALQDGLAEAGLDRFDLLGFDACLMAGYEVASAMAPYADHMIASSELEPGHGWDYRSLATAVDGDVDTLGRAIVDGYEAHAAENGDATYITLSMVDLTQMGPVDEAVSAFAQALAERGELAPIVGTERAETLEFGKDPDPTLASHVADLGTLVSLIGADALDVSDQADAVVRAMNDAVTYTIAGPVSGASTGLSIYFPPEAELYDAAYDDVPSASDWAALARCTRTRRRRQASARRRRTSQA